MARASLMIVTSLLALCLLTSCDVFTSPAIAWRAPSS
jgi:hypothetical protein